MHKSWHVCTQFQPCNVLLLTETGFWHITGAGCFISIDIALVAFLLLLHVAAVHKAPYSHYTATSICFQLALQCSFCNPSGSWHFFYVPVFSLLLLQLQITNLYGMLGRPTAIDRPRHKPQFFTHRHKPIPHTYLAYLCIFSTLIYYNPWGTIDRRVYSR